MAGEFELQGKNAEIAIRMLQRVTEVLDEVGVKYFLDAGTLLGIVRENRLLPWDCDMDISIPRSEYAKLRSALPKIWLRGYRIRTRFHVENDFPVTTNDARILKIRNRNWWGHKGQVLLDVFVKTKVGDQYIWIEGVKDYVKKATPARFHDELTTIRFEGKDYPVPADYDGYLTQRYGDWRTPVKVWDHLVMDKSIMTEDSAQAESENS